MQNTLIIKADIIDAPGLGELRAYEDSYLVAQNGRVSGIYSELPAAYAGAHVEELPGHIVMPAFCDMHLHAPQYPMLGLGMDLQLLDWLKTYTYKNEARFADASFAREVYRALAHDMVSRGTTRAAVFSSLHREATLILMEELERAGISGYVGKVNMDRNGGENLQEETRESIAETERFIAESSSFKRIRPIITPRFTPSCTDELMAALGSLAEKHALRVQSHLSENTDEIAWVRSLCPDCATYWESYYKRGLWRDNTLMAHCVYSDEAERAAMREHGVWAVHCPDSNTNIASGIAPVREMLDEGVRVALGSDIAGGALLSMNETAAAAVRASKLRYLASGKTEAFLTVAEGFYLAAGAAAPYFGEKPGFAQGAELHAIAVSEAGMPKSGPLSLKERFERVFYLMKPGDITNVWAAGKKIK